MFTGYLVESSSVMTPLVGVDDYRHIISPFLCVPAAMLVAAKRYRFC